MADDSLQSFVETVNGTGHLRVEHDFGDGFVRLHASEAERRQAAQDIRSSENIVLELLRNARDAHASHVFVATTREGARRMLTVIDDGDGIPELMHEHVFEPRVTSKLDTSHMDAWGMHGRGMALYSISVNSESAKVVQSSPGMGCALQVVTDTSRLAEKADQSSFPTFTLQEGNSVSVRGPRNIARTTCEFALEERAACSVYLGTPTEVAATLHAYGTATLTAVERVFCQDESSIPLVKRLATAADPQSLAELCESIGLALSQRSARRILDGGIAPLDPLLDLIRIERPTDAPANRKRARNRARIKMDSRDIEAFREEVSAAFRDIAERYYLSGDVEPTIRLSHDCMTVRIPLARDE